MVGFIGCSFRFLRRSGCRLHHLCDCVSTIRALVRGRKGRYIQALGLSEGGKCFVDCLPGTAVLETSSKSSADARLLDAMVGL